VAVAVARVWERGIPRANSRCSRLGNELRSTGNLSRWVCSAGRSESGYAEIKMSNACVSSHFLFLISISILLPLYTLVLIQRDFGSFGHRFVSEECEVHFQELHVRGSINDLPSRMTVPMRVESLRVSLSFDRPKLLSVQILFVMNEDPAS